VQLLIICTLRVGVARYSIFSASRQEEERAKPISLNIQSGCRVVSRTNRDTERHCGTRATRWFCPLCEKPLSTVWYIQDICRNITSGQQLKRSERIRDRRFDLRAGLKPPSVSEQVEDIASRRLRRWEVMEYCIVTTVSSDTCTL
jgi:hypothetical protein